MKRNMNNVPDSVLQPQLKYHNRCFLRHHDASLDITMRLINTFEPLIPYTLNQRLVQHTKVRGSGDFMSKRMPAR